jgi:hypothetical protein
LRSFGRQRRIEVWPRSGYNVRVGAEEAPPTDRRPAAMIPPKEKP